MSLTAVARLIQRKKVSSVEVTKACLDRIEAWQPRINCFIAIEAHDALKVARKRDRELAKHGPRGPLHGVPLAHKDVFYRKGRCLLRRVGDPAELDRALRLNGDRQAGGRRSDLSRKTEHGRVRGRPVRPQRALRTLPQSVEPRPHVRGFVQRLRHRRRGAPGLRRARNLHGRLGAPAGGRQRRDRPDADLWSRQPPWRGAPGMVPGPCGAPNAHGAGLCTHDPRHRGLRRERRYQPERAGSRLRIRGQAGHSRHQDRDSGRSLLRRCHGRCGGGIGPKPPGVEIPRRPDGPDQGPGPLGLLPAERPHHQVRGCGHPWQVAQGAAPGLLRLPPRPPGGRPAHPRHAVYRGADLQGEGARRVPGDGDAKVRRAALPGSSLPRADLGGRRTPPAPIPRYWKRRAGFRA